MTVIDDVREEEEERRALLGGDRDAGVAEAAADWRAAHDEP